MAVVTYVNVCYLTLSMRVKNIGTNFSAKTFEKDYTVLLRSFPLIAPSGALLRSAAPIQRGLRDLYLRQWVDITDIPGKNKEENEV